MYNDGKNDAYFNAWDTVIRNARDDLNISFNHYLDGLITWNEYCVYQNDFDALMRTFHKTHGVG